VFAERSHSLSPQLHCSDLLCDQLLRLCYDVPHRRYLLTSEPSLNSGCTASANCCACGYRLPADLLVSIKLFRGATLTVIGVLFCKRSQAFADRTYLCPAGQLVWGRNRLDLGHFRDLVGIREPPGSRVDSVQGRLSY
jgi:hypothetical protein